MGDAQSWNRYAYVENDPINLSDPSGQGFWEELGLAIAGAFVAAITFDTVNIDEFDDPQQPGSGPTCPPFCLSAEVIGAGVGAGIGASLGGRSENTGPGSQNGPSTGDPASNTGSDPAGGGGPNRGAGSDNGAGSQSPGSPGGQSTGAPGSWGAGGDGPVQQLKYTTIPLQNALAAWSVRCSLTHNSPRGGWVVQHIVSHEPPMALAGMVIPGRDYDYWEAWQVNPGQHLTAQYNDNFRGPHGTTIEAQARFYEGLSLPSSFVVANTSGNPAIEPAGNLRATAANPHLSTANATAINHRWFVVP